MGGGGGVIPPPQLLYVSSPNLQGLVIKEIRSLSFIIWRVQCKGRKSSFFKYVRKMFKIVIFTFDIHFLRDFKVYKY